MSPNENKVPSAEEILSPHLKDNHGAMQTLVDIYDAMTEHTRLHLEAFKGKLEGYPMIDTILSDYLTKNKLDK